MEQLKTHFLNNVKKGIVLSVKELQDYCLKRRLDCPRDALVYLRHSWKFLAAHTGGYHKRRPAYMGMMVPKYGMLMLDFFEFHKRLKRFNEQKVGFIIGQECLSQKVCCVPVPNKSAKSWYMAIRTMLEESLRRQAAKPCVRAVRLVAYCPWKFSVCQQLYLSSE